MKNPPIIIIGAGRSGTNILRDSICTFKGFETWPCDEINYIWRHGNIKHSNDRFQSDEATPKVKNYIQKQFEAFEKTSNADYVVEKTCANSLKVPFINVIFPNAKYIFLIRDGRDVTSSAKQRWTASLELKYIWKKVKYVPVSDIPYYGSRYLINRIKKLFTEEKRLAYWGPIYPSMRQDLKKFSLLEVCALQWKTCVETANADLDKVDEERVYRLRYKDFVQNPVEAMRGIMNFLNQDVTSVQIENSVRHVSPRSIRNYKKYIKDDELIQVDSIIEPVMNEIYDKIS